ncbi:hypothetical protein, partial [Novipirellula herctigrandis]|uniref:hypothetical protein n=1 Tax=Novipirellula herctigrandis TaxID=2527986 RepID=UPI003AF392C3
AHGAAGRADSEINVVCRGPVNGDVPQQKNVESLRITNADTRERESVLPTLSRGFGCVGSSQLRD